MENQFLNKYEQKSEFAPPEVKTEQNNKSNNKSNDKLNKSNLPKNKKVIAGVVGGVALLIIVGIALFFTLNNKTVLPNMEGWKENDVNLWATENSVMLRYTESYSDDVTNGLVISHSPGEGEIVEKGTFLEVEVSKGADPSVMVEIPDFMSMTQSEIEAWETTNHMSKVRITAQNSKTVEIGKVISFTVNDTSVVGAQVRRDSPIYIIISNGTGENGNVTVPDFTLMTLEQAKLFAEDNEIELEIEEVFNATIPKEQIISQDIELEEIIKIGDTIKLKVSLGPEIIMPDFSAYESDMALTIASQNGIMVMVEEKYSSAAEGKLISQSLKAGSLYDTKDILVLKYSLGNTVLIPSYIGQGVEAFEAWATEYNGMGTSITIKKTYTTSNDLPGTIITQDKTDVMSGISTTVNVVVSEGKVVYVPDFVADAGVGYDQVITREKAIALCEEAGLVAIFQSEADLSRLEGEVFSQSIGAGKEVQQGTTITLKYRPVTSSVSVPNLVGLTVQQILDAGYHRTYYLEYDLSLGSHGVNSVVQGQSVTPGTTVAPGAMVCLTLDAGSLSGNEDGTVEDTTEESIGNSTGSSAEGAVIE